MHEFWQVFTKMRDLKVTSEFLQKWKATCGQFEGSTIELSWEAGK